MMQLPQVISRKIEGDTALFRLCIQPELSYFDGHFNDQPILAGVVQIGWVVTFAAEAFAVTTAVDRMGKIKFNHIIEPGNVLDLRLELERSKQRLSYIYSRDGERMSSGEILLRDTS